MTTALAAARQEMSDMSLTLPPEFERAIRERLESGAYESLEAVFRACLEALEQWEDEQEAKLEALRREVVHGAGQSRRGEGSPTEDVVERIRQRVYSGEYASTADVLNTALSVLDEAETDDAANDELRALIDVGLAELDRGEGLSGEEFAEQIRADIRRITGR